MINLSFFISIRIAETNVQIQWRNSTWAIHVETLPTNILPSPNQICHHYFEFVFRLIVGLGYHLHTIKTQSIMIEQVFRDTQLGRHINNRIASRLTTLDQQQLIMVLSSLHDNLKRMVGHGKRTKTLVGMVSYWLNRVLWGHGFCWSPPMCCWSPQFITKKKMCYSAKHLQSWADPLYSYNSQI